MINDHVTRDGLATCFAPVVGTRQRVWECVVRPCVIIAQVLVMFFDTRQLLTNQITA